VLAAEKIADTAAGMAETPKPRGYAERTRQRFFRFGTFYSHSIVPGGFEVTS